MACGRKPVQERAKLDCPLRSFYLPLQPFLDSSHDQRPGHGLTLFESHILYPPRLAKLRIPMTGK